MHKLYSHDESKPKRRTLRVSPFIQKLFNMMSVRRLVAHQLRLGFPLFGGRRMGGGRNLSAHKRHRAIRCRLAPTAI